MENTNESNNVCKATKPTGVELIAYERNEQINKHGKSLIDDKESYPNKELMKAAVYLLANTTAVTPHDLRDRMNKIADKSYRDRLIIAGALIAAEIDRIS